MSDVMRDRLVRENIELRDRAEAAESERDAALVALASQDTYTEEGGLIVVGHSPGGAVIDVDMTGLNGDAL